MSEKVTKAPPQGAVDRLMKIANAGLEWQPMSTAPWGRKVILSTNERVYFDRRDKDKYGGKWANTGGSETPLGWQEAPKPIGSKP